jgi:hypothetical protein
MLPFNRDNPGARACKRGLGTSAASRRMNSSGDSTKCVVPSRQGVLSFSTTLARLSQLGLDSRAKCLI